MTIDDLMTNMTEVELRCMFFWGATPQRQFLGWLSAGLIYRVSSCCLSMRPKLLILALRGLVWIALSHLGTCVCHSELRLDLGFSQALADALLQRKTSVRDTTADSDLDDGAKAWGSEWLHASCITMRSGLSFSVAAALISKFILILFNFSKHLPSLPLCLVACSTGE